jgi:hypothetical protein
MASAREELRRSEKEKEREILGTRLRADMGWLMIMRKAQTGGGREDDGSDQKPMLRQYDLDHGLGMSHC